MSLRDQFHQFENSAKTIPDVCQSYRDELHRSKKRKVFSDESTRHEITLTGQEQYQVATFNVIIDKLVSCLGHRMDAYRDVLDKFKVLFIETDNLTSIREQAEVLCMSYPSDLDVDLANEIIQFRSFIQNEQDKSPQKLLKMILKHGLQSTFPSVFIALRIFFTLPVTNCEGERSFSHLARIKNELRTTQTQQRLSALSLMAIETELLRSLELDEVITDFANRRARKKFF